MLSFRPWSLTQAGWEMYVADAAVVEVLDVSLPLLDPLSSMADNALALGSEGGSMSPEMHRIL